MHEISIHGIKVSSDGKRFLRLLIRAAGGGGILLQEQQSAEGQSGSEDARDCQKQLLERFWSGDSGHN